MSTGRWVNDSCERWGSGRHWWECWVWTESRSTCLELDGGTMRRGTTFSSRPELVVDWSSLMKYNNYGISSSLCTMYTNSACTNIKLSPFKSHFPCFTVWLTLRATLRSGSEVVWGERLLWPFLKIVLLWMKTFLESSQLLNGKPDCLNIKRKIANRFKVQQVGLSKIMKIGADFSHP